ncbi:MAG: hypothetical protein HYZ53_08240 [Planctomycetes bacterium]|nr:hypothetical protein [Planctomycetota bacterium]
MTDPRPLDRRFFRRVYRASFLLFCLALLVSLGKMSWRISGGLALGFGLSLGTFAYWEWVIRVGFSPAPGQKAKGPVLASILLKLPVLVLVLYFAVSRAWVEPVSLAIGILLVHLVVFLKVLGRRFAPAPDKD